MDDKPNIQIWSREYRRNNPSVQSNEIDHNGSFDEQSSERSASSNEQQNIECKPSTNIESTVIGTISETKEEIILADKNCDCSVSNSDNISNSNRDKKSQDAENCEIQNNVDKREFGTVEHCSDMDTIDHIVQDTNEEATVNNSVIENNEISCTAEENEPEPFCDIIDDGESELETDHAIEDDSVHFEEDNNIVQVVEFIGTESDIEHANDSVFDDAFNVTNNSIIIDDLEAVSDDLRGRIDDRIIFVNDDDMDTELQILHSDLEYEFFDILNDSTAVNDHNKSLFSVQDELITILNDIKSEQNEVSDNSNESNSLLPKRGERKNSLSVDENMYNLSVWLETKEDNYYQQSIVPTPLQLCNQEKLGLFLSEKFLEQCQETVVIFKHKLDDATYKLELFKEFEKSFHSHFCHLLLNRLILSRNVQSGYLVLREVCLISVRDYLNFSFNFQQQLLIKKAFFEKENVLDLIDEIFHEKNGNVRFWNSSRRIGIDIIWAIEYLHKRNVNHGQLSTTNIGITVDGHIKVGGLDISSSKYMVNSFSFDYLILGQVLTEIFIPGLNVIGQSQPLMNLIGSNLLDKERMHDFNKECLQHIGNRDLGNFLQSFYRPCQQRCSEYVRTIIFRKYRLEYEENIISLDKIRKLSFFSDLSFKFDGKTSSVFISEEFLKFVTEKLSSVPNLN